MAIVLLADALADPDIAIRRPWLLAETLLVRRVDDGAGGTHIVVAVVTDEPQTDSDSPRLWVATAFLSEELPLGTVIWERR
ncbi:MAG: hypothetical protein HY875_04900 [Chloroflexi bacterium]|nr:hypothetical protein [Chloroflexota bacterium]